MPLDSLIRFQIVTLLAIRLNGLISPLGFISKSSLIVTALIDHLFFFLT